jgi:hypothetical protein
MPHNLHREETKRNAENPLTNYDYRTTKHLLWRGIMNKCEALRREALLERRTVTLPADGPLLKPSAATPAKPTPASQSPQFPQPAQSPVSPKAQAGSSPGLQTKVYNTKAQRLKQYAEKLEIEKGKDYEDGMGRYKENVLSKFGGRLSLTGSPHACARK